jgi:hypothetical protein
MRNFVFSLVTESFFDVPAGELTVARNPIRRSIGMLIQLPE